MARLERRVHIIDDEALSGTRSRSFCRPRRWNSQCYASAELFAAGWLGEPAWVILDAGFPASAACTALATRTPMRRAMPPARYEASRRGRYRRCQSPPVIHTWSYKLADAASYDSNHKR